MITNFNTEFFLSVFLPWVISIALLVMILIIISSLPRLLLSLLMMSNKVKILFLICLIGGVFVRFYWTPFTHRIYYDEDRYLTFTVSFAKYGKAVSIITGSPDKLLEGAPDQAVRLTPPVLNAWILKFFGYTEYNLFFAAKIINSLQIPLIFILSLLLFNNFTVAIFAAFGMAFLPNNVYWATSTTLDPYFVTFALFSMVGTIWYSKNPKFINGIFTIASVFCLLCVRIEAFLFLPIMVLSFYLIRKDPKNKNKKFFKKIDLFIFSFAFLLIGIRAVASISVLGKQWCCAENLPLEAFYPIYFIRNLLPNIYNLFNRMEFPFMITLLAIASLVKVKNNKITILVLWIISYFIIYSLYYAGMFYTYEFSGSYGRYFLILTPAILILAGLSVDLFLKQSRKTLIIGSTIFLLSIMSLLINYKKLIYTSPYSKLVDEGPVFIHEYTDQFMIPNTPKNSVVINNLPAITIMSGRSSTFLGSLMNNKIAQNFVVKSLKNKVRVFSTVPYNCINTPQECEAMFKLVTFEPVILNKNYPKNIQFAEVKLVAPQ